MKSILFKTLLKNRVSLYILLVLVGLILGGCASTKKNKKKTILLGADQNTTRSESGNSNTSKVLHAYRFDDHEYISLQPDSTIAYGSWRQTDTNTKGNDGPSRIVLESNSPVANKIVENYLNSENKEPKGHCLSVSKGRFEKAYKAVHGHSLYQDLPDSMATMVFTSKQVFNLLYASASETEQGWRSLPEKYRGKGNAGAIAYAGMGTLIDASGVWSGELRPGALMQVWRYKEDYEQVVQGVDVKKLDPYGHSFIFISYVRDEQNEIIGLKIADQGFQSYRPLEPRDYEVWWGVNLSI